jgi:signal transduction histidine kinase
MPESFASHLGISFWFPLFVVAVLEGLAVYTWRFRQEPGARAFVWLQACKSVWLLGLLVGFFSAAPASLAWSMNARSLVSLLTLFFSFRFTAEMSGCERELPRWVNGLMGGVVGAYWLLILINQWNGWLWKLEWTASAAQIALGPASWVPVAAGYAMSAFIAVLCILWLMRSSGLRRRQAALILVAFLLSWFGHMLTRLFGMTLLTSLPLLFLLSSTVMAWAFHRWRIYGIVPLAQEVVVKTMIDGLMVVDDSENIVALNPTARALFPPRAVTEGAPFQAAFAAWPALAEFTAQSGAAAAEASRQVEGSARFYRVTTTPLRTALGQRLGRVLIFKDVTLERQQQERIVEQQKALSTMTERQRLGRELHDGPGQIWSFITMQIQSARNQLMKRNLAQAEERLERLAEVVREVHFGMRESITGLQTGVSGEQGLLQALEEQLRWYREHCDLEAELEVRCAWQAGLLSPGAEAQALRIVQEALANVRKSAQASRVRIAIRREAEALDICVEDNGCGFDAAQLSAQSGHHGLRIMRERAEEIKARLEVESEAGMGTRVRLRIPVAALESAPAKAL